MAERMILVCDVCGAPASESVSFSAGGRRLQKDLCGTHLAELVAGAHPPKRGRRPGSKNTSSTGRRGPGRPRKATTAKASSNGRRRGRRSAAPAAEG